MKIKNNKTLITLVIAFTIFSLLGIGGFLVVKSLSPSIEKQIKVANLYIEAGDLKSAKKIIEKILLKDPDNKEAFKLLKKITELEKNPELLNKVNENDKKKGSNETIVKPETKKDKTNTKNQNEVKEEVKKEEKKEEVKIDKNQQTYDKLVKEGELEYKKQNFYKAIEYFKEALKYKNNHYKAYQMLSKSYLKISDDDPSNLDKAIDNGEKAIKYKKDDIESYLAIADSFFKKNQFDKSLDYYKKAAEIDKFNEKAQQGIALSLIKQGKEDEAKPEIDRLYTINPQNYWANKYKGKWLFEQKDYTNSIPYLQKAYEKNDNDKENIYMLAKGYYIKKKYNTVINILGKSITFEPLYKDEFMLLALSYWKTGSNNLAKDMFNRGINIPDMFDPTYSYKIYYNFGKFLESVGQYKDAEDKFLKAIEQNPQYYLPYEELGSLYVNDLKEYDKAINTLKKAIDLGRKNYTNYYNLAVAYKETKQTTESLQNFKLALTEAKKIKDVKTRSENTAKILTLIGSMIYDSNPTTALNYYNTAIGYSSPFAETYYGALTTILKLKDYSDKNKIEQIIAKGNTNIKKTITTTSGSLKIGKGLFYLKAAKIYSLLDDLNNALEYSKKSIDYLGNNPEAYDLYIELLIKAKKYKEALSIINDYMKFANDKKKQELIDLITKIKNLMNS